VAGPLPVKEKKKKKKKRERRVAGPPPFFFLIFLLLLLSLPLLHVYTPSSIFFFFLLFLSLPLLHVYTTSSIFFFFLLLSLPLLSAQLFFPHFSSSLSPSPICTPSSILFFFPPFSSSSLSPPPIYTLSHPSGLRGWSNHPLCHPSSFTFFFFFLFNRGWSGHPLGHWVGLATTRQAGLVVAQPLQWPKGWPATPMGGSATLLLSLFFF
jgi:hypothetical protein